MGNRLWTICGWPALLFLVTGLWAPPAEGADFKMKEVSAFDKNQDPQMRQRLQGGQFTSCTNKPDKKVKAYPKLESKRPMYGTVTFDGSPVDPSAGIQFRFVLDESGELKKEREKEKEKATEKAKEKEAPKEEGLSSLLGGFAAGASKENAPAYDRLYFDANRDLDLTNDPVVKLMKDPPPGVQPPDSPRGEASIFDYLDVKFDYGPKLGTRSLRILPRLYAPSPRYAYLTFVPAVAREGKIRIGKQEYKALLSQSNSVTGRFDRPFTQLYLTPVDGAGKQRSAYGSQWLCALRQRDGKLYAVSATPTGDKITVEPFGGEMGVFKVGPGKRDIKKLGASGAFISDKPALVFLGDRTSRYSTEKSQEYKLPVGNYMPMSLSVDFGRLTTSLTPNFYGCDGSNKRVTKATYPIKIRKDKPCVLDFSSKPAISFLSPAEEATFKPGKTVRFAAFLADPGFNLMVRGLSDTSQVVKELKFKDDKGKEVIVPRYATLQPQVVITDSSGKEVAKGKMPFG